MRSFEPTVYFCYTYSAKVWPQFNERLGIRQGQTILRQESRSQQTTCPKGKFTVRYGDIGRQNQVHVVVHLRNCRADLGRKGFQKEIVEFKSIGGSQTDRASNSASAFKPRPVTGAKERSCAAE